MSGTFGAFFCTRTFAKYCTKAGGTLTTGHSDLSKFRKIHICQKLKSTILWVYITHFFSNFQPKMSLNEKFWFNKDYIVIITYFHIFVKTTNLIFLIWTGEFSWCTDCTLIFVFLFLQTWILSIIVTGNYILWPHSDCCSFLICENNKFEMNKNWNFDRERFVSWIFIEFVNLMRG